MMVLRAFFCSVLITALLLLPVPSVGQQIGYGFAATRGIRGQSSAAEITLEKKFRDGIVPADIRENMRRLSARPHHVGSPYDKDNAEWILAQFKAWGFDAHIETFQVLFPYAEGARRRTAAAHAVQGKAQRVGGCRGPHLESGLRTVAHL